MGNISDYEEVKNYYQTPDQVCKYMASLIPNNCINVLEPCAGSGNLVSALENRLFQVTAPKDYFLLEKKRFDAVCMNPPFSSKSAFLENGPKSYLNSGMKIGYQILLDCMEMSDHVVALMPWFTLSDSDVRLRYLKDFGMRSITALPRKTFNYVRIQTVVIELEKGFNGQTEFKVYDLLPDVEPLTKKRYRKEVYHDC